MSNTIESATVALSSQLVTFNENSDFYCRRRYCLNQTLFSNPSSTTCLAFCCTVIVNAKDVAIVNAKGVADTAVDGNLEERFCLFV